MTADRCGEPALETAAKFLLDVSRHEPLGEGDPVRWTFHLGDGSLLSLEYWRHVDPLASARGFRDSAHERVFQSPITIETYHLSVAGYHYAWFVGFALGLGLYAALRSTFPRL
jgi:hypothetical protein